MLEIYRLHNPLLIDIDTNYLRSIKKIDYRKEVFKNLPKVIDMFVSSMQSITKKSIDQFTVAYKMRNPNSIRKPDKL
jgi:hypothetical protein